MHSEIDHEDKPTSVPIEIQIRTVFEDAWGEIDHKLRYSIKRNKQNASGDLLENWEPHLNVLKSLTDGCAQYAGVIKSQAIDSKSRSSEIGPFKPVDEACEALSLLGDCSASLRAIFESAYQLRFQADGETERSAKSQLFISASHRFDEAFDAIANATFDSSSAEDAARFFSRMESAFCLLSEGSKASLDRAIKIYSDMQQRSPSSVIVYYRYAQALSMLNSVDDAIPKYVKAEELLSSDVYVPKDHWLRILIPRNLGYAKWSKSALCDDTENGRSERLALLVEAFELTRRAFLRTSDGSPGQTKCANNALYYGVEYMALQGTVETGQIAKSEVLSYLKIVERELPLGDAPFEKLNWVDTLCRAYALFGMEKCAVLAAERIEHLLSEPKDTLLGTSAASSELQSPTQSFYAVTKNLNETQRNVLDHALWVLRKYGPGPEEGRT